MHGGGRASDEVASEVQEAERAIEADLEWCRECVFVGSEKDAKQT